MKNNLQTLLQKENTEENLNELLEFLDNSHISIKEVFKMISKQKCIQLFDLAIKKDKPELVNAFKKTIFLTYDLEMLKKIWEIQPIDKEIFEVLPALFQDMNNSNMIVQENGEIDSQYENTHKIFNYLREQKLDWNKLTQKENISFHASYPLLYELIALPTNKIYENALKHAVFYSVNKDVKFWLNKVSIKGIEQILLSRNINPEMKNQYAGAAEVRSLLIKKYLKEKLPLDNEIWINFQKRYKAAKNPLVLQELADFIIKKDFDITLFTEGEIAKSLSLNTLDKNKEFFKVYGFENKKLEINLIRWAIIDVRNELIEYYVEMLPNAYKYLNSKEFKSYKLKIKPIPKHAFKNDKRQHEALDYFEILAMNKKLELNLKNNKNNSRKLKL